MGCWNETCGFSRLPILYGDEVIMFAIAGRGITDGVYSTGSYHPISLGIVGTYNDYGGIENIKNPEAVNILYKEIINLRDNPKTTKLFIEKGDYDLFKEKKLATPKDMMQCIERGYLIRRKKWSVTDTEESYISYMMIHKRIFDKVVEDFGKRIPYKSDGMYKDILVKRLSEFKVMSNSFDKDVQKQCFLDGVRFLRSDYSNDTDYIMKAYFESKNDDLLESIVNLKMVMEAMEYSRIAWNVYCGRGSQSSETAIHQVIWKEATSIIDELKKEHDRDSHDDNDPEEYGRETLYV